MNRISCKEAACNDSLSHCIVPWLEQAAGLSAEMPATVPFILMIVPLIVNGYPFSWEKIVTAVYAQQEILHS